MKSEARSAARRENERKRSELRSASERAKEALIKEMVHSCNWNIVQNQGKKHSNTGSIVSIFNDGFGQYNIADVCQRFNQCFPNEHDR